MTKQTEALKMAIDALEMHVPYYVKDRGCEAIQACKEALEQQSVAELNDEYLRDTYVQGLSQPAQEPVAWCDSLVAPKAFATNFQQRCTVPLYTHPAPSWQGLSDDEICDLWTLSDKDIDGIDLGYTTQQHYFAALVEQALKEKNHG